MAKGVVTVLAGARVLRAGGLLALVMAAAAGLASVWAASPVASDSAPVSAAPVSAAPVSAAPVSAAPVGAAPVGAVSVGVGRRVALVIGNGRYPWAPLRTAVNDARDIATALRAGGFDVLYGENTSRAEMNRLITEYGNRVATAAIATVYYSGHAIQVDGRNYLVPIDAVIGSDAGVVTETIEADRLIAMRSSSGERTDVVILDACHVNPFAQVTGGPPGLVQTESTGRTMIAYPAAPGQVVASEEGTGRNSLYVTELLRTLYQPDTTVGGVFGMVRAGVSRATAGRQTPWESSRGVDEVRLTPPGEGKRASPAAPHQVPAPVPAPLKVETVVTPVRLQPVVAVTPVTAPPPMVSAIDEAAATPLGRGEEDLALWTSIQGATAPAAYDDYLSRFPNGAYAPMARAKLDDLKRQQVAATTSAPASPAGRAARPCAVPAGTALPGTEEATACRRCHSFEPGKASRPTGPTLAGIFGARAGSVADYRFYSEGMKRAAAEGVTWTAARLDEYLKDPRAFLERITGNPDVRHNMFFKLPDDARRAQVIAYITAIANVASGPCR
ncbi:MAG: caspase family protein [Alphaproteobacteria bacterium]